MDEIARALRVADQLVTAHSCLRDSFGWKALVLDLLILGASIWLVAAAFLDPAIAGYFTIPGLTARMTIGLAAVATFILSIFQLLVDWKQKSSRHAEAAKAYVNVKFKLNDVLRLVSPSQGIIDQALAAYKAVGGKHISVPERDFNRLKRKHLLKVRVSKMLDATPGAGIVLIRLRIFCHDVRLLCLRKGGGGDA